MQVNINKELLLRSLTKVQSVVEKKGTMPIMEHVKIEIAHSYVRLTATNSEVMISDMFPIQTNVTFSFTTIATILYEIIKKMYDTREVLFIMENEKELLIRAGRSRFKLPCLPVEEFPGFDINITGTAFTIKAGILAYLFEHTKHAICSGEVRYYLNGAFFHVAYDEEQKEQVLRVVATDSFRFAGAGIKLGTEIDDGFGVILSRKTVGEVLRMAVEFDQETIIRVQADNSRIVFSTPEMQLVSKVIDARFPDYREITSIKYDKTLTVGVRDLKCAVDLVTAASDARDKEIRLVIGQEVVNISIEGTSVHNSYGSQIIQAVFNGAEEVEILLNSRYLLDCLGVIEGDVAIIGIGDNMRPIIVRDRDDPRSIYVLMPLSMQ